MAYGSINSDPLIAADLLGVSFWNNVRQGQPAGEALRRAKIQLAQEMQHRQGYLDGEDQKTLISFILYGDPLAQPFGSISRTKGVWRSLRPPSIVKTVCDRSTEPATAQSIPPEVMVNIKSLVSQYLPGMAGAQVTMTEERASCSGIGHECPTGQLCGKARPPQAPQRRLITLSKQVEKAELVHPQYARLTLDAQNHLVKLAVSR